MFQKTLTYFYFAVVSHMSTDFYNIWHTVYMKQSATQQLLVCRPNLRTVATLLWEYYFFHFGTILADLIHQESNLNNFKA